MMSVVISVLVISSVGAFLALMLVVAERFIANYGECRISINDEKEITVKGGQSLLSSLTEDKIFIPSACGGRGTCGFCKVKVIEGAGAVVPTEEPFLSDEEKETDIRLSCQVKVRNDLAIEIAAELLAVKEYQCVCREIVELTYDTRMFRFELTDPDSIDFVPGQYVQLLCPCYTGSGEEVYRAYSVASDPAEKNFIELVIRRVPNGICTTYCFDHLKVGDAVRLNGPYGDFRLSETDAPMIFIAGGSGMAPFLSILSLMENTGNERKVYYFFGGNHTKDLFCLEQMRRFAGSLANFEFIAVVANPEEGWQGETGLVTEAVGRRFDDISVFEGYLCGSPGMIDASMKVLIDSGMGQEKIYYDKFA